MTADVSIGPIRIEILLFSKLLTVNENIIQIVYNLFNSRLPHKRAGDNIRFILKIVNQQLRIILDILHVLHSNNNDDNDDDNNLFKTHLK